MASNWPVVLLGLLILALVVIALAHYTWRKPAKFAGVEVTAVYLTAGDNMLDVRYRIKRRGMTLAPPEDIYIMGPNGQKAGAVASAPKIGRLAPRRADRGAGGYVLLRNAGNIARGDTVTVVIGNTRRALPVA